MSEPSAQASAESDPPFRPELGGGGAPAADKRALYGCSVGCLVLASLLALLLVVLMSRPGRVLRWMLQVSQQVLIEGAPQGWTEAESARLEDAFGSALEAIEKKIVDVSELEATLTKIVECLRRAQRRELRREDLEELTEALERVGVEKTVVELFERRTSMRWSEYRYGKI